MFGIGWFSIERDLERRACMQAHAIQSHKQNARIRFWAQRFLHTLSKWRRIRLPDTPFPMQAIENVEYCISASAAACFRSSVCLQSQSHSQLSAHMKQKHSYLPSLREKTSLRPFPNNFKHAILKPRLHVTTTFHRIQMQESNYLVVIHDRQLFPPPAIALCRNKLQTKLCESLHSNPKAVNGSHEVPAFPWDVPTHCSLRSHRLWCTVYPL